MTRRLLPRPALAIALAGLLAALASSLLAPPAAAGTAVVFIEDFEDGAIGPQWSRGDNNAASGLDYWGVTGYRVHAGNFSAWAAQVGTQSDSGLNNSAVHRYDDNMQADLSIDLRVRGFSSLTLSFYYWWQGEGGGGDFIQAWYEASGVQYNIFTNFGSANWDLASVAVPNDVERLIIRVTTDGANHGREGGYVDDVVLTGTENSPPSSNVLPLPTYAASTVVDIPFRAADGANESGVAYVELWYRAGTTGPFTRYTGPANPLGRWVASPVPFDVSFASGEGHYEFYTVAVDNAQNAEAPPATADESITVDATAPGIAITAPAPNAWVVTTDVTVRWQGSDSGTGLDRYEASLDGGAFADLGLATQHTFPGLAQGGRSVTVRAFDRAGNVGEAAIAFRVDTVPPAPAIETPAAGALMHETAVTVTWSAADATSGGGHFEVWLDDGAVEVTTELQWTFPDVPDGDHTVHLRAFDAAGNSAETSVAFRVSTGLFNWDGPYGPFPLLLLIILIAMLLAWLLLWWWKRREEREDEALAKAGATPEPQAPPEPTGDAEGAEPPPPDEG